MRNKIRPISLILLLCILGFMLAAATSCTSVLNPERQAKLDAASDKYQASTGITPAQSLGLLQKWLGDYTAAKAVNIPQAIPAEPAK